MTKSKLLLSSSNKHNVSSMKVDGDQKKVRGVEIVETMLRVVKEKLESSLCDEVKMSPISHLHIFKLLN